MTIIGAGTDVGTIAALFLKQQKVVKVLALYDDVPERGVVGKANDIAHIDTSTRVEVYQGRTYLKAALHVIFENYLTMTCAHFTQKLQNGFSCGFHCWTG